MSSVNKVPEYLHNGPWPVMRSQNRIRSAGECHGDVECPFCDYIVLHIGETISIGDACPNCGSEIVKIVNKNSTVNK